MKFSLYILEAHKKNLDINFPFLTKSASGALRTCTLFLWVWTPRNEAAWPIGGINFNRRRWKQSFPLWLSEICHGVPFAPFQRNFREHYNFRTPWNFLRCCERRSWSLTFYRDISPDRWLYVLVGCNLYGDFISIGLIASSLKSGKFLHANQRYQTSEIFQSQSQDLLHTFLIYESHKISSYPTGVFL